MFAPKEAISQGAKLYQAIKGLQIGTVLSYDMLSEIMGYDIQENRAPINAANKTMLNENNAMLLNVRGVGYKIANPTEQLIHAGTRPGRAKRQLKRGRAEADKINMAGLSDEEKAFRMRLMVKIQQSIDCLNVRNAKAMDLSFKSIEEQKHIQYHLKELKGQLAELQGQQ